MRKRLVIGMVVGVVALGVCGCTSLKSDAQIKEECKEERQEYAKNAYNLGVAEALVVTLMPPEEAAEVQSIIHQAMNQELSLEEQEKVLEEVFSCLSEYITTDLEGLYGNHQM